MDHSQYLQDWPAPEREIDATMPTPWCIAGYTFKAVDNVLRVDYGAARNRDGVYQVPGGALIYIGHHTELHGRRGGTLFVLFPWTGNSTTLDRIIGTAASRGMKIEGLASGPIIS